MLFAEGARQPRLPRAARLRPDRRVPARDLVGLLPYFLAAEEPAGHGRPRAAVVRRRGGRLPSRVPPGRRRLRRRRPGDGPYDPARSCNATPPPSPAGRLAATRSSGWNPNTSCRGDGIRRPGRRESWPCAPPPRSVYPRPSAGKPFGGGGGHGRERTASRRAASSGTDALPAVRRRRTRGSCWPCRGTRPATSTASRNAGAATWLTSIRAGPRLHRPVLRGRFQPYQAPRARASALLRRLQRIVCALAFGDPPLPPAPVGVERASWRRWRRRGCTPATTR